MYVRDLRTEYARHAVEHGAEREGVAQRRPRISSSPMKAVVMAGGQGSRLRPLTSNQPKPMLPIVGQPMMQHILRLLRRHGFTDVVATVQFLASIIRNYFGDGSDLGVSLNYATEEEPLGTAGSVKHAEHFLDDTFLVISGDALTDLDLTSVLAFHRERAGRRHRGRQARRGPPRVRHRDRRRRGPHRPVPGEAGLGRGVHRHDQHRHLRDRARGPGPHPPVQGSFDFAADLFPLLLDKGMPMHAYRTEGYWTDIGTLESYFQAHRDILDGKVEIEFEGFELGEGVRLGLGAEVDPEAQIAGPAYIGENSRVEAGATIREYTALGKNVVVKGGAFLHRAIVHDNAYIGPGSNLRGCVVGKNTDVKRNARLEEGVVVADECYVGDGAVINPRVKVYPFKSVDAGALVTQSIIWESHGARSLFGQHGVAGLVNIDVTPEMAMRLALAFGSTLPKTSVVTASRDVTRTARIIKRAMVAGLNAAGVGCHDLELVPPAVARHYARSARAIAGICVRTAPDDAASVQIQFFDGRGVDIDLATQRKLERTFYRDDFRRAFHHEMGELNFPARGREYYTRGMRDAIDLEAIRESNPKLVLDYAYGAGILTAPAVLGRVGADVLAMNAVLDEDRVVMDEAEIETPPRHGGGPGASQWGRPRRGHGRHGGARPPGGRPGARAGPRHRPARLREPGRAHHRGAAHRGAGDDPSGARGDRGHLGRRDHLDEGRSLGADGRGRRGQGRVRGRRRRRLDLPRVPGRVRRRDERGEAVGAAGPRRGGCRRWSTRCRRCTWSSSTCRCRGRSRGP